MKGFTMNLYVVLDRVSEQVSFGVVSFVNHGSAIRWFQDLTRDRSGPVGQHPVDYDLVFVGTVEQSTGEVSPVKERLVLSSGVESRPELVKEGFNA